MVVTRRDRRELATLARGNTHFGSQGVPVVCPRQLFTGLVFCAEQAERARREETVGMLFES
jgi:hypothetical protein